MKIQGQIAQGVDKKIPPEGEGFYFRKGGNS